MKKKTILAGFLVLGSFLFLVETSYGFRLYLEAEEARNLPRYPYDKEDCPTWYSREANTRTWAAPGRSWCAAIHENAREKKATISLPEVLPAGKYLISIRTIGPISAEKETAVKINLGQQSVTFSWLTGRKRFVWQPLLPVSINEPIREISFEVMQFGGRGYGGLTEPLAKTVWIDTIYLTDNLQEKQPPDYFIEIALRAGWKENQIPERAAYHSDQQYETPCPAEQTKVFPIVFKSYDGRVNLWPNSSFELGMNDGWASAQPYVFSQRDLSSENPFHGHYCLKLPAGIEPFSRPYFLQESGIYTLSFYARAQKKTSIQFTLKQVVDDSSWKNNVINTKPIIKGKAEVSSQWQRTEVTAQLEKGWYYLSFSGDEFFLDAIQLEKGGKATSYAPRAELEGALRTDCPGNIIYEQECKLILWWHNSSQKPKKVSLFYQLRDVREKIVSQGKTEPVSIKPGETLSTDAEILPPLRGIFSVMFSVEGRSFPEGETVYVVMPEPAKESTRHQLGANISLSPAEIDVQSRLGLKWVLTCKTREIASASEGAHPAPDKWNWVDEKVVIPGKFGMNLLPCFWPHRIPVFMQEPLEQPGLYRTVRGAPMQFRPKIDLWKEYVGTIASHYQKTIKHWCIDDEAECSWTPDYYAAVVSATCDGVHERVPEIKVGLSAAPEFTEELFRYVSPEKIDFLGGSFFDYYYHEAQYLRRLKERYGKAVVSFGVGGRPPENTMYHTLYTFQPPYFKAAWMARLLVYQFLVSDLDISGHYAGILRNNGAHLGLNKPLCDYDGTPYPWGATFGCLGTLLADAESLGEVKLGTTDRLVFLFRKNGKIYAVTWSTNTAENDMHWKPARRQLKNVRLECPPESMEILDMYWNKLSGVKKGKNWLSFDVDEEPVFFQNKNLSEKDFISILQTAKVDKEPVQVSLFPVSDTRGKIQLKMTLINNSSKKLEKILADFRYPQPVTSVNCPLSTSGCWVAPRVVTIPVLPAGKSTSVFVPSAYQADFPLEAAVFRCNLKSNQLETACDNYLWIIPVFPLTSFQLEGKLTEWENLPAAWISYQRHWNFSYRWYQFLEGEGSFGYPSYTLDSRVAFWLGWDKTFLLAGIRVEDEQVLPGSGESLKLLVSSSGEVFTVNLIHLSEGNWSGKLASAEGKLSSTVPVACQTVDKMTTLEISIPWKLLRVTPFAGQIINFDLFWTDVDVENGKKETGTMHWAGGARWGYAVLR